MSFRVWAVRAGGDSEADPLFIESGRIAVSFRDADQDVSAIPAHRAAFKDVFFSANGEAKPAAVPVQAGLGRQNWLDSYRRNFNRLAKQKAQ